MKQLSRLSRLSLWPHLRLSSRESIPHALSLSRSLLEVLLYLSQTILQAYSLKVLKRQAACLSDNHYPTPLSPAAAGVSSRLIADVQLW